MVQSFLAPSDCEELVVSYLSDTFSNVSVEMTANAPLPFVLVTCLDDPEDMVTAEATVSVHVFNTDMTSASANARQMHIQMKNLLSKSVEMSDGSYASIDHIEILDGPHWVDYGSKEISRYVARYHIGRRCNLTS